MRRSARRIVRANGVDLCVQTFGDDASPSLLLIAGAASSMDWWEAELCERLAAGPRQVIRYDFRDTGESVTYVPGKPTYGLSDLVADALGLLDALEVARAHLVGMSLGATIALRLALNHSSRVASLTLISASPGRPPDDLPAPSAELAAFFANPPPDPTWSDRTAVIEYIVEGWRPFVGRRTFDEERLRALAGTVVDRTVNIESSMTNPNHWVADGDEPVRPRLGEIAVPTLVLHGNEDPMFPLAHGEALAREIPNARLLPLEGVSHEFPPRDVWDLVVAAILDHTAER